MTRAQKIKIISTALLLPIGWILQALIEKNVGAGTLPAFIVTLMNSLPYLFFFTGLLLILFLQLKWKLEDWLAEQKEELWKIRNTINNHAVKIHDIDKKGIKRLDMVTYYDPKLKAQFTPLDVDIQFIENPEDKYCEYLKTITNN